MFCLLPLLIFVMIQKNVESFSVTEILLYYVHLAEEVAHYSVTDLIPKWFEIFPGTKWCGNGNVSKDPNELGMFRKTDECCRSHDYCPDTIAGHKTKNNLTNPTFYSRLNCQCDEEFHRCLKSAKEIPSKEIGLIYFNVLGTQCYKKEYPIISCKKYSHLPIKKCTDYVFDLTTKDKIYQWFDLPNY